MKAKTNLKSRRPSRHVTEGPPRRSCGDAMGLIGERIHRLFIGVASWCKEAALENAAAPGGSTNVALHLPAIAPECGIAFDLFDVAEIFKRTPYIADLKPGSRFVAKDLEDLFEVGGIPLLMKSLLDNNFLHGELERRAAWQPCGTAFGSGYIWKSAQQVGPARHGAVTHRGGRPRRRAMWISNHILPVALLSLGLGLTAAHALEFKSPANSSPVLPGVGPVGAVPAAPSNAPAARADSLETYFLAIGRGDTEGAVKVLENAFRSGDVRAGWRLARDYADGKNGVVKDQVRAFEIFQGIVDGQRGAAPTGPSAWFVADALVSMGLYYLAGIPNSAIKADPVRAFDKFNDAAINFANADGQLHLARAYLDGQGVTKNPALASKWFYEAAKKGQSEAQAEFGKLLVQGVGQVVPRDIPQGLMWLKIAVETAPQGVPWIQALYDSAWKQATDEERAAALVYFEQWKLRVGRLTRSPG